MAGIYTKKILIVEDEEALAGVLTRKLSASGYDVYLAKDGEEAIQMTKKDRPDLVLLDMQLPIKSGMDVLEEIRKDDVIKFTKVIIISNSGQPIEIERALELGVKDYLIKAQFDPDEVLQKVKIQLHSGEGDGSAQSVSGKKVLVVEDDKFLRDLLAKKLENQGVKLLIAVDGEQGLSLATRERPDIMLLDILMPGMDGFTVLEKVRANPELSAVKVVMLSNFGQREDIDKANRLGANLFLVKAAVTLDEIVEKVKDFLLSKA